MCSRRWGVNISIPPEMMKECLDKTGICFLFAPALHKAMKYAIAPRKEVGSGLYSTCLSIDKSL
jgi:anthranilate phosphoribosyltransferase